MGREGGKSTGGYDMPGDWPNCLQISAGLTEEGQICPPRRQQRSGSGEADAKLPQRHPSQTDGRPNKDDARQLEQGVL